MDSSEELKTLSRYNLWANRLFVDWLSTVDSKLLTKEGRSSFNTIQKTIQHISKAQEFWSEFTSNGKVNQFDWRIPNEGSEKSFTALIDSSEKIDTIINTKNASIFLEEEITLNQPWLNCTLARREYLKHILNHSTYHRGQIVTMARNLGIDENIPNTDYLFFLTK